MTNLPQHWRRWLKQRGGLTTEDFDGTVRLSFEDGSRCVFRDAIMVTDCKREEVAVFTEHCGYHIFPLRATTLKVKAAPC